MHYHGFRCYQYLLQGETEYIMETCIAYLPANSHHFEEFCSTQKADTVCLTYCHNGWPEKWNIPIEVKHFWQSRGLLTIHNNLLLYGLRIVIPASLQQEILSMVTKAFKNVTFELINQCGGLGLLNTSEILLKSVQFV